ncbi:MAG TPA: hypothetical protein VGE29_05130 [Prosthecobacter sp.]
MFFPLCALAWLTQVQANDPVLIFKPGELDEHWPSLQKQYLSEGQPLVFRPQGGGSHAATLAFPDNANTVNVALLLWTGEIPGSSLPADAFYEDEWMLYEISEAKVVGVSTEVWSEVAEKLNDAGWKSRKDGYKIRTSDGKVVGWQHYLQFDAPLKEAATLADVLKVYFAGVEVGGKVAVFINPNAGASRRPGR